MARTVAHMIIAPSRALTSLAARTLAMLMTLHVACAGVGMRSRSESTRPVDCANRLEGRSALPFYVAGALVLGAGAARLATMETCSGRECYLAFDPLAALLGVALVEGGGALIAAGGIQTYIQHQHARCEDVLAARCHGTPDVACRDVLARECASGDRAACWAVGDAHEETPPAPPSRPGLHPRD